MSRSKNEHKKRPDYPKRIAKDLSKKNRRAYGAKLVKAIEKAEDADDIEMAADLPKDAGKGDIWLYD